MKPLSHFGRLPVNNLEQYRQKSSTKLTKPEKKTDPNQKLFNQKLKSVAQEFESLFTHQMLKQMRSAVPKSDFIHGGNAEKIFTDMLDQEISKIASKRGIGISDMVYAQLQRG